LVDRGGVQRKNSTYAARWPRSRNRDAPARAQRLVQLWDALISARDGQLVQLWDGLTREWVFANVEVWVSVCDAGGWRVVSFSVIEPSGVLEFSQICQFKAMSIPGCGRTRCTLLNGRRIDRVEENR
jgi:hypothetical protein